MWINNKNKNMIYFRIDLIACCVVEVQFKTQQKKKLKNQGKASKSQSIEMNPKSQKGK